MDMKWNPIIDGDLSGIPRDEYMLFTTRDIVTKKVRTAVGKIDEHILKKYGYIIVDGISCPVNPETLIAWMKFPEPFKPNDCNRCAHYRVWIDGFGDRWSKCELWNEPFAMDDCPLR